jgi:NAD(P)-dependent dehydrogenase (short-subunit alcohol dehydrogenase family)
MDLLKNKVALITGGSRGLGASIAKHFFNESARIILCDIDIKKANKIANELNSLTHF